MTPREFFLWAFVGSVAGASIAMVALEFYQPVIVLPACVVQP